MRLREKEQSYVSKCICPHPDMTCSWIQHAVKFLNRENWGIRRVGKCPLTEIFASIIKILHKKIDNVPRQVLLE